MARKHYYFVPLQQDDPTGKPASMVADFQKIPAALEAAMIGRQMQPVLL
jgi:dipicolinate synthase subunit B